MAFRSVVIKSRCKLEFSLNYLVCVKGGETTRVLLDEIKMIVIESTQVSITTTLISACLAKKIKILFADEKFNLTGELTPYYNNYYASRKIKDQISIPDNRKHTLWTKIVERKIYNQLQNLKAFGNEYSINLLNEYLNSIEMNDTTNREGLSAKVYFFALFGNDFNRKDDSNQINKFLNYGYTIILSAFNRAIKSLGFYTELGIHHIGDSNSFNLSCDLMEPLRPLVDLFILKKKVDEDNFKNVFIEMLSLKVYYNQKEAFLDNAIELYTADCLNYLISGDKTKIQFIGYEL